MIFSSWLFACFFLAVFGLYWSLHGRRARHLLLLGASYLFYMSWNPWLVSLILGSTVIDYAVGRALAGSRRPRRRKALLAVSLVGNLGVLAIFKYADFFILSLRETLAALGVQANLSTLSIILPVGISFYTFQTLSYTIDIYRGRLEPKRSFVDFALFVAFFPQLVAGPIVRAREFLPQLETAKRFDWRRLESGAVLFLVGLTKKVLIADNLAGLVDPVFADPTRFVTRDLWLAMFCYGGQIYCDFSGYSDMAIAAARVLGFDLRANFANPYLATSLVDFWRRWHISLSTWLRDYLYIPLGGSRAGGLRTCRNLMITMLLGGLWHGASWTFVIWGAIHGLVLMVSKAFSRDLSQRFGTRAAPRRKSDGVRGATGGPGVAFSDGESAPAFGERMNRLARTAACWAATLLVVHVAWVFFRCQPIIPQGAVEPEPTEAALRRSVYFVTHLIVPARVEEPVWLMNKLPMVCLLALMAGMHLYEEWVRRGRPALRLPAPVAGVGYAAWILALVILSPGNVNPFIYFQF